MINRQLRRIALILILATALYGVAAAADSPVIQRSIVPNGVATDSAGDIVLTSYVGESMATGMVNAGEIEESSGFLQEVLGTYWRWLSTTLRADVTE